MTSITELSCRVCLQERDVLVNIYDDLEDWGTNLSTLLQTCADVQINTDDIFPKYLCEDCTGELLITSKFREKCNKSKEILKEILANSKGIRNEFDIIEYYTEGVNDVDDLIIEDYGVDYEPQIDKLIDVIDQEKESTETLTLNKTFFEPLEDIELPKSTVHDNVLHGDFIFQDKSKQLYMHSNKHLELEDVTEEEENMHDISSSVVQAESMNVYSTNSLVRKAEVVQIYKCDVCGALFKQVVNLQRHLKKIHSIQCFICSKCNHCFSLESELYKHILNCGYSKEICDENVKNKEGMEYSRKCMYCEKHFPTPFALRMHLRTHTGERPFQCKYCTKSFKTQSHLNVHHKRHTGQADFICTYCNKSFFEQSNLIVHMRSHTGERPHVCSICKKTFGRVFLLQFHMRIHTGEKPFKCDYCDKSFRQHTDLRSHLSIHTGQKPHSCITCGKSYIKRSNLVQHMRKHEIINNNAEII